MANLVWGITGASDKLLDSFDAVEKVAAQENVRITTFISQAGIEIVRSFSLQKRLTAISNGEPYREIVTPKTHGASTHIACRFYAREYEVFVVAPCSGNTMAKLRVGIADTPVASAASWALKGGVSVFLLQTHLTIGKLEYPLAVRVIDEKCKRCDECPPARACRYEAIKRKANYPVVNFLKCVRCGDCVGPCPHDAIAQGERFRMNRRMVDQQNAEELSEIKGIAILSETRQVGPTFQRYTVHLPDY